MQLTLAIDFDGTLCEFAYPGIGKPKDGAKEAMAMFRRLGYKVLIYTCRTCHWHYDVFGGDPSIPTLERPVVKEMITWLDHHGIEYDEIDDGSKGKPMASLMIDDKAIRYENNWTFISKWVLENMPQ